MKQKSNYGFALPLTMLFAFLLLSTTMLAIVMLRTPLRLSGVLQDKAAALQAADSAIEIGKAALSDWLRQQQIQGNAVDFTQLLIDAQANNKYLKVNETIFQDVPLSANMHFSLKLFDNINESAINDSDRLVKFVATAVEGGGVSSKIEAYVRAANSCWHGEADGFCLPEIPASGVMCNINTAQQDLSFKKQVFWMQKQSVASGFDHQVLPDWNCQQALANTTIPLWQKMQECLPTTGGNTGIAKSVRAFTHGDVTKFKKIIAKSAQLVGTPEPLAEMDAMNCGALQQLAISLYQVQSNSPKLQRLNKKTIAKTTFLGDRKNPMVTIVDSPKGAVYFKKGFHGAGILIIHGNPDFKKYPATTANFQKGGYFEGLILVFGKTQFTALRLGNSVVVNGAAVMLAGEPLDVSTTVDEDPSEDPADDDENGEVDDADEYDADIDLQAINNQENFRLRPHAGIYFSTTALNNAARAAAGLVPPLWNKPSDKIETVSWREIR